MAFEHSDKKAGDLIRSADWNLMGTEVVRLGIDKISRVGAESLEGPLRVAGELAVGTGGGGGALTVRGDVTVGTANAGAGLRVYRRKESGRESTHGALVLGNDSDTSATLRMGYADTYSWIQGQGQPALALNPYGGSVGVGTDRPGASALTVSGGASIGAGYAATAAPGNGLIVEGRMGVGVAGPVSTLQVNGDTVWNATAGQRFIFHTRGGAAGDFLHLTVDDAAGNWDWSKGISLKRGTGNVGIGTNDPGARLHVAGDVRLDAGREVVFADNGQIRSLDNNHRILFRRTDNKLELREWGDIVLSPGATSGTETAKATLTAAGRLAVGTASPQRNLHVEGSEIHSGGPAAGYSFSNRESAFVEGGNAGERWAWYSSGRVARLWTGSDRLTVAADGTLTAGAYRFGNNSVIMADQGGSIELGGDNNTAGTGIPYIDFHFRGLKQDYNTRIINDDNGRLSILASNFQVRDCFGVSLWCADFNIGHPTRRGSPGRAIVDGTTVLYLNYDNDWSGGVQYWGGMTKVSTRDIKEDISTLGDPEAASLLAGLDPVRYRLIGDANRREHLGFIAEEVPDAIAGPDHRSINESHIVAVLTRVVKEQQRRLDELTHRLDEGLSHA